MPKRKIYNDSFIDPTPKAYSYEGPEALSTELVTLQQIRQDEQTIIWGLDDALPLHILTAIAESPVATLCLEKLEMFTRGSGFSDEGLMTMVINDDGETLWDLHCSLVQYFVALDGFSPNFKYNNGGKIINVYNMPTNSCRFMGRMNSTDITGIKYNPYFGTKDYQIQFTKQYNLFNLATVKEEAKVGNDYEGQIYFYGTKRTLFKHYPVPKFWSAQKWILSDAQNGEYNYNLLANSFLQSALMKVIGDPNSMSRHPLSMKDVKGTDGITRKEPTLTNGQVFDRMMASNFSGVKKAGTVMTLWSLNKDQATDIQAFPTNINPELIDGTLNRTIRMISGAMQVPGILANLPDSTSPLSGQDALPHAIDFMQSNTDGKRTVLEQFYNKILLPNFKEGTKSQVKIKLYDPVKLSITVDPSMWQVLTVNEKREYIKENTGYNITVPNPVVMNPVADKLRDQLVLDPPPVVLGQQLALPLDPNNPDPTIPAINPQIDEVLKGMKVSEIDKISSIVKRFNSGKLTLDQAQQFLAAFGLTQEQQTAWLNPPEV